MLPSSGPLSPLRAGLSMLLVALCCTCGAPRIKQQPLVQSSAPPVERPDLLLYRNGLPVEPSGTDGAAFHRRLAATGYRTEKTEENAPGDHMYHTFTFRDPGGKGDEYRLAFLTQDKHLPKLKTGKRYQVTYFQNHRGMFLPSAQGVVIRDNDGNLVYLLSSDDAVPLSELPEGLSITPSRRIAFATNRLTATGCNIDKEHHFLDVTTGDRTMSVTPGQAKRVRTKNGYLKLTLFDYSVSQAEFECMAEAPPYFTYLLEAEEAPD